MAEEGGFAYSQDSYADHKLGYHPLLATRAGSDEVLHIRLWTGSANTQRGAVRFVDELTPVGDESEVSPAALQAVGKIQELCCQGLSESSASRTNLLGS